MEAAQTPPSVLDIEVLQREWLLLPNLPLLGRKALGERSAHRDEKATQAPIEFLQHRRRTAHHPGAEQRTERVVILSGKGERGLDCSGGVADLDTCVP